LAALGPFLYLPFIDRPLDFFENPLVGNDSIMNRIAWGGFSLIYYLKLIIFPHPLRYYYGYNMFPDVSITNIWVILGILLHLGLFIYAIITFRKKHIISFAILAYLSAIAMFLNTVKPVPGIIGERYLWIPSIGFAIALSYFLYKIFLLSPKVMSVPKGKMIGIIALTVIIMVPYSAKTYVRNLQWKSEYTLFAADMPYLWDSFKANDQYADEIMQAMNKELAKPVNVLKFIDPQIREALMHWERAREIYPEHYSTYNNMGLVYSRVYQEHDTAITLFEQALERRPDDPMILFNMGMAYEGKGEYTRAISYFERSLDRDPEAINTRSRLANIFFGLGEFKEAIEMNQEIMRIAPQEALPYVNIGNYYIFQQDTLNGIKFYEKAVELGAPPEASNFLSRYFMTKGDIRKSNYYKKIAEDLRKQQ
jgi:tetratricopeptide (TPR) repeat protein